MTVLLMSELILLQIDEKGKEKSLGENFKNYMTQAALKFVRYINWLNNELVR